jgi:5-aminolevulinate synthase
MIAVATAIRHLKTSQVERERHQERAATLKRRLAEASLPVMPSPSHIVPVKRHRIYLQPINYLLIPGEVARESGMMSPTNPI